ncbi:type II toxin-antitoxin system VapC family toxin [Candidatus Collierbacteria bacterium]|nr:type II toxin-antitoxin system VapC family toxin [Candidatus Collierbacteria bacterium]
MDRQPIIVVDADALVAQINHNDVHHRKAVDITQALINVNAQIFYPITAIIEANAHVQRIFNSTASAYGFARLMADTSAQVVGVNKQTLVDAIKYFDPQTSKKNTLFDCIVAAVAEENEADAIFSFDKFYKRKGFVLASDYFLKS